MLCRVHRHLGHPRNHSLVIFMKTARCQDVAIECARCLQCPFAYGERHLREFGGQQCVAGLHASTILWDVDLTVVKCSQGIQYTLLNSLELATMYNSIVLCVPEAPAEVAHAFRGHLGQWAGPFETRVAGNCSECGAICILYWWHMYLSTHGTRGIAVAT